MQQRSVIGIFQVFKHQFPVTRDKLTGIAENFQFATIKYPFHIAMNGLAQKIFLRLCIVIKSRKNCPIVIMNLEDIEAVFLALEVVRHAALLLYATPQRHTDQVAF